LTREDAVESNSSRSSTHSATDDDAVTSGSADALVLGVGVRGTAGLVIGVAAAGTATVELDAVAGAGDAVALARAAAGAIGGNAGWRGGVGAAGAGERWNVRLGVRVDVGLLVDVGIAEAGGELVNGGLGVALGNNVGGLDRVVGLWALDVGWADGTATRNVLGHAARGALGGIAGRGLCAAGWDIEDVQLALGGWLKNGLLGWVMGAVVAIHDVVVPVALALLKGPAGEAESAVPVGLGRGGIARKRKLSLVVVPRPEQVDGLALRGSAEVEAKLESSHFR